MVVPVISRLTFPTLLNSDTLSPPRKDIRYWALFRLTVTSRYSDKAFTTETPTPCNPPENW